MFQFLKQFFGPKPNLRKLISEGALVVDVRTEGEFALAHLTGSKSIPLSSITDAADALKLLNKPIITVCRSGSRSSMAQAILTAKGVDAYNGGAWTSLQ